MSSRESEIRARLEKATKGPWEPARELRYAGDQFDYDEYIACTFSVSEADADLIANAPADIDYLLAENVRLRRENDGPKTAEERGLRLATTPQSQIPMFGMLYAKHLCQRVGMCGEVFVTAFANYAHFIEKLPFEDPATQVDDAEEFFSKSHKI